MKKFLTITAFTIVLAACGNSGPAEESSRQPKGNPNAAVTVWEFADLQCPACRAAHTQINDPLMQRYGNDIALQHMHFPLRSIHRYALEAAEASECAADQGKFWEYADLAFENQPDMDSDELIVWAEELNLDMDEFNRCVKSGEKRDIVLSDYEMGRELGVGGTPTYFVNGQKVETGFDTISAAIDAELERLTQQL